MTLAISGAVGHTKSIRNIIKKKKISKVIVAICENKIIKNYCQILKKDKPKFITFVHPKSYTSIGFKMDMDA